MATPTSSRIEQHPDVMALRARSERADATPAAQAVEALSVLTGLYLAASPWIVGFNGFTTLAVTNLIAGLAFVYLAIGRGASYERTHGMSWAAAGIGVWTILAPWVVVGDVSTTRTIVNNVITGGLMILMALITSGMAAGDRRR